MEKKVILRERKTGISPYNITKEVLSQKKNMELHVRNAAGILTSKDSAYAQRKLSQLDRTFAQTSRVEFVHTMEKQNHFVAVTVLAGGHTVRSQERDPNLKAAIDLVVDKVKGRLRRLKDRLEDRQA
jgi:ribosomal subunit interface protein